MLRKWNKNALLALLALLIVTGIGFWPLNSYMIRSHPHNDFGPHISFARSLDEGGSMPEHIKAHPIWQLSIFAAHRILGISWESAAVFVQVIGQLFLAAVLFLFLYQSLAKFSPYVLGILSLALMLVTPIMLLVFWDDLYYLGYLGINTHHNPTINILKPFTIILFVYALGLVQGTRYAWWHWLSAGFLVIVSTLIKPSFIICLLPALAFFLFLRIVRKESLDWGLLLLGFGFPAGLVLVWQFLTTFGADQGGVLFAPLVVMKAYSDFLLIKFLLSIWFPLGVSIVYFRKAVKDPSMLLSWFIFVIGAVYTYLLAEEGVRLLHANWGWSGEIGMFILFVVAMQFFMQRFNDNASRIKWWALLVAGFLPHLVAGGIYLGYVISSGTFL